MEKPVLYCNDGSELELPTRWEICGVCQGNNVSTANVECDGGGFTSSEWAEQDEDFRDDYLAGRYDRPCPHCEGGKVRVADLDRMTPEEIKEWNEQCESFDEMYAIECAERKMGC